VMADRKKLALSLLVLAWMLMHLFPDGSNLNSLWFG